MSFYKRLPEETQDMTVEEFANWLLALPSDVKNKQIWFLDVNRPYKDKPLAVDLSPSGTHISIEDDYDEEPG